MPVGYRCCEHEICVNGETVLSTLSLTVRRDAAWSTVGASAV